MGDQNRGVGLISWIDLTVGDAEGVRAFYEKVAGWSSEPVSMGGYNDFTMQAADGDVVGGICHARGDNAELPNQWMIYITVADLDQSVSECRRLGGEVLSEPRQVGSGRCAVIRDPGGACAALYQHNTTSAA